MLAARGRAEDLLQSGLAVTAPAAGQHNLPPPVAYALFDCQERAPAVLITNAPYLNASVAACTSLEAERAMREWHRIWVCGFSFGSMDGSLSRFQPTRGFAFPTAPPLAAAFGGPGGVGPGGVGLYLPPQSLQDILRNQLSLSSLGGAFGDGMNEFQTEQRLARHEQWLDDVELPAVAVCRKYQIEGLASLIDGVGHSRFGEVEVELRHGGAPSDNGGGGVGGFANRRQTFADEKKAWDVLNKIIFFAHRPDTEHALLTLDRVIPSDLSLVDDFPDYMGRQLKVAYPDTLRGEDDVLRAVAALEMGFTRAARAVRDNTSTFREHWLRRLSSGRMLTDQSFGVVCCEGPDPEVVWLRYPAGGSAPDNERTLIPEEKIEFWRGKYENLKEQFAYHQRRETGREAADLSLFHTRLFCMAMRYESLSHTKSAYQSAVPQKLMRVLQAPPLWVQHECFASPLNHYMSTYCSLFPDTDRFFGSLGNFYGYSFAPGCYECNPPFDNASVTACFYRLAAQLGNAESLGQPLSFLVVLPRMDFLHDPLKSAYKNVERFRRHVVSIRADQVHVYYMGLQHRPTGKKVGGVLETQEWVPVKDSYVYVLQTEQGVGQHPMSEALRHQIHDAFLKDERDTQAQGAWA